MQKKSLSFTLIVALLLTLTSAPQTLAQAKGEIQQQIQNAGVGAYLEIRLQDGSQLEGRIEALEPTQVTLTVHNSPTPRQIHYDQIASLKSIHRTLYRAKGKPDAFLARQAVETLNVGEHVMVRTAGDVIRRGNIKAIDAETFTIRLDKTGAPATIHYREIYEIHENPHLVIVPLVLIAIGIAVVTVIIAATRKSEPQPLVSVITPGTVQAGKSVEITIKGSNFATGDIVSFKGGKGPTPTATNVRVNDATTITATVTVNSGGPSDNREWDVIVTNAKRKTGKLKDGFVVTP
jgi:ribosome maturation factor RimP